MNPLAFKQEKTLIFECILMHSDIFTCLLQRRCIVLTENGILIKLILTKLAILDLHHSRLRTLDLGVTPNHIFTCLLQRRCIVLTENGILIKLKFPYTLNVLDLNSTKLRTLDLSLTSNLEELNLEDCNELAEIHMPAASLKLKQIMYLHNSKWRSLKFGQVPNIETLSLQCYDLCELHMPEGCLKLRFLYLSGSKLSTLDMGLTPDLKRLYLKGCSSLVELLDPSGCRKTKVVKIGWRYRGGRHPSSTAWVLAAIYRFLGRSDCGPLMYAHCTETIICQSSDLDVCTVKPTGLAQLATKGDLGK
ncbi:Disease resistance protein [Artemisia annua]|uniref:Disease resistance protein n=1 Tax=Artemisia annua TaxID=35608 RepID=A0A2U1PBT0_ARTAN|nr:Disease resistance protein [Artemisia annua]